MLNENKAFAKKKSSVNRYYYKEDLIKIYGIGEVISLQYLKLKKVLEFVSMEQMNDVWGLSPEVENLNSTVRLPFVA
jgi:hypothetical protein